MADPRNDQAYAKGFDDGKNGNLLDDLAYGLAKPVGTDEDKCYCNGYEEGTSHRYDSDND